jgi:hypothetical protein
LNIKIDGQSCHLFTESEQQCRAQYDTNGRYETLDRAKR